MEIQVSGVTVNIPKNEYVQSTEVRQEVVQFICEYLINGNKVKCNGKFNNCLYIRNLPNYKTIGGNELSYLPESVRIHGVEMQAAFDALQNAGYYLHASYCISDEVTTYVCCKTPYYNGFKCSRRDWDLFID